MSPETEGDTLGGRGSCRASAEPMQKRRHPTHGVEIFDNVPTIVFLTVCTKNRKPWLATEENHEILRAVWKEATAWFVGRYVIMPDHLHLFASPGIPALPLESWVKYWKSQFSKRKKDAECRWQTDHWDYRLRKPDDYDSKWDYVVNNPVRHQLARTAEEWPFQGCLFELRW